MKDDVFDTCDWCSKPILYGNAMVTVNRHIEQIDRTKDDPDGEVTVIDSAPLLTLCGACGNRLDSDRVKTFLLSHEARTEAARRAYLLKHMALPALLGKEPPEIDDEPLEPIKKPTPGKHGKSSTQAASRARARKKGQRRRRRAR